jgi:hypothetical protein
VYYFPSWTLILSLTFSILNAASVSCNKNGGMFGTEGVAPIFVLLMSHYEIYSVLCPKPIQ